MRVGYVLNKFPLYSETFVTNQIISLAERGHDVTVLSLFGEKTPVGLLPPSVKVIQAAGDLPAISRIWQASKILIKGIFCLNTAVALSLNPFRFGREIFSLRPVFASIYASQRYEFDIVHTHFGPAGIVAVFLRSLGVFSAPIVTTIHAYGVSKYVRRYGSYAYKTLFRDGEYFLSSTEFVRRKLLNIGCPEEKMSVFSVVSKLAVTKEVSNLLPPSDTVPALIVSVARLTEKKGLSGSIDAVANLIREGLNVKYVIIGEGELRKSLNQQIINAGMSESISLYGAASSDVVADFLKQAHIFLLASVTARNGDIEGLPVSIREAMAVGCIVISTYHSGIPEIIESGVNGYLVPEHDTKKIAETIKHCCERFPDLQKIRQNAQSTIANSKSYDSWIDRLEEIFNNIIALSRERS